MSLYNMLCCRYCIIHAAFDDDVSASNLLLEAYKFHFS